MQGILFSDIASKLHETFLCSLMTDPLSGCLNIAQDFEATDEIEQEEHTLATTFREELRGLTLSSRMRVGYIKHFKLLEGSFVVDLSAI